MKNAKDRTTIPGRTRGLRGRIFELEALANGRGIVSFSRATHLTFSEALMFLGLALVLFVIWILCVLAFKITVGAIHILVVIAIIAFIMHFVRGRRSPAP